MKFVARFQVAALELVRISCQRGQVGHPIPARADSLKFWVWKIDIETGELSIKNKNNEKNASHHHWLQNKDLQYLDIDGIF